MHLPTTLTILFYLITLLVNPIKARLGINCRGSGMCPYASWQNKSRERITQVLRDAVWDSPKPNSTTYGNGDHVICVSQFQTISLTGGQEKGAEAGGASSASTSTMGLSGVIGGGGICLFPQYMDNGAVLTLGDVRALSDEVLEHGCKTCGSVPIHYVDWGSNDSRWGILTFNYVDNPYCIGNCLSANGQPWINGTVQSSGTQYNKRFERSAKWGPRVEE